jgi:hypothetical protein
MNHDPLTDDEIAKLLDRVERTEKRRTQWGGEWTLGVRPEVVRAMVQEIALARLRDKAQT